MTRAVNSYTLGKIKQWEGLQLVPYQDQAGVWTDGYGNTLHVVPGRKITEAKAESDLIRNLQSAESAVERLVKVVLNDYQFGALVSFVFNIGESAFASSTLLKVLNQGKYELVPAQLMRWNKITVGGKKAANTGLTNRRAAEAGLWAKQDFVATNTLAPVPPKTLASSKTVQGSAVATVGALGAALTDASNQVSVVADYSTTLRIIFIVLTLAGIALTVYGRVKLRNTEGV